MGLLDGAIAPTIDTYEQTPAQGTSTGFDANLLGNPAQTTANTYTPSTATANTFGSVDQAAAQTYDPTMVEDRLTGLLNKDSDYMKASTTKALQQSNQRGLANSSMAAGAGRLAAIQSALPIASQDATAFNQADQWNAGQVNNVNANNAGFANQAAQANANAENQFGLANQSAENRAALDNANFLNTADQFNATTQNQFDQINQQTKNQTDQYNSTVENEFSLKNMDAINQAGKDFAAANNAASLKNAENNMKLLLANAEEELSNYSTDIERKTALDGIASKLVQSGLSNGVFATSDGAANWISMIGDLYPDMGLSVTTQIATEASKSVV